MSRQLTATSKLKHIDFKVACHAARSVAQHLKLGVDIIESQALIQFRSLPNSETGHLHRPIRIHTKQKRWTYDDYNLEAFRKVEQLFNQIYTSSLFQNALEIAGFSTNVQKQGTSILIEGVRF